MTVYLENPGGSWFKERKAVDEVELLPQVDIKESVAFLDMNNKCETVEKNFIFQLEQTTQE